MASSRFRYEGLQVSPAGVWVHFRASVGTTFRHCEMLIPWSELTGSQFLRQLDREVARQLVEAWSGVDIEPLF